MSKVLQSLKDILKLYLLGVTGDRLDHTFVILEYYLSFIVT